MVDIKKFPSRFELSPTLGSNEFAQKCRAEGKEVLHMGCGESPFPVHPRLQKALADNTHHKKYEQTIGAEELRHQIKEYYTDKIGMDLSQHDVIVGPGSKILLYTSQYAIKGDLLHVVPSWVSYAPQARLCGDNVIDVPAHLDDDGMHIDPKTLEDIILNAKDQGLNPSKIILNSPSNPTGLKIPPESFEDLAAVFKKYDIAVIWDDIYGLVNFDGQYDPFIKVLPENTILTSAVSKHLSLGGWRAGFAFIPKSMTGLIDYLRNYSSETWSAVAGPIQHALIQAYKGHQDVEDYIKDCAKLHGHINQYVARTLKASDIDVPMPSGAFYCYVNYEKHRDKLVKDKHIPTGSRLADYLMYKHNLITLSGICFGEDDEKLILRVSAIDYDAESLYNAYKNGETLDDTFIQKYAPRVYEAVQKLIAIIDED